MSKTPTGGMPVSSTDVLSLVGLERLRRGDGAVREDLVRQVRGEIDAGIYETNERIDGALSGLAAALNEQTVGYLCENCDVPMNTHGPQNQCLNCGHAVCARTGGSLGN